ncbi:hypothetical protein [Streptomyces sp. NRRL B-24484]|uniref:hypothetical protein n=1 Tax=Streptomyces sp. NRRL B-24484 TaxID=1463833 RepID=UPI0004C103C9|nr:hypothetical protein [Streptomyces sp. NRRL B-24484]
MPPAAGGNSRYRWIARRCLRARGEEIGDPVAEEEAAARRAAREGAVPEDPWADPQAVADARRREAERPEDTAEYAWLRHARRPDRR